jgi:cytochrome P450 family 142 subfamily A polypeptide 1
MPEATPCRSLDLLAVRPDVEAAPFRRPAPIEKGAPMPDHPTHPDIRLMDGQWYQQHPFETYRWMRDNAPVYWDDDAKLWGISRHADIQAVSRSPQQFCSGKGSRPDSWTPTMINHDDPEHKRRRNLVNRGFTKGRVEAHEPKIRQIVTDLIDSVITKGECEFVFDVAAHLPMIVIGDMLGVKPEDRADLLRWSDDLIKGLNPGDTDAQALAQKAGIEYFQYAQKVIEERRANPTDDLMSVLCFAEIDGEKLSDDEIIQESLLILIGGDETTRHVITEGAEALIRHPAERQRLIDDPSLIPTAIEEMLRWVSPIKNMSRTAVQDTELHGQKIREGDKLLLLYHSANRDERVFDEPERFDVARKPNEHLAFGGFGAHFCLGASLARLELRVMFEELIARLPDMELASDAPLRMRPNNFIVGIEEMPVRFAPR